MELQDLTKAPSDKAEPSQNPSSPQTNPDQNPTQPTAPSSASLPPSPNHRTQLSAWWTTHVSLTLPDRPPHDARDYLALERTFLGWIRTSTAVVSLGVVVTQLFVLHDVDPTKGKVLGSVLAGAGMVIVAASAGRYFRAQSLLVRGKALTGGWEAIMVWAVIGVVLGMLFLVVVIEV